MKIKRTVENLLYKIKKIPPRKALPVLGLLFVVTMSIGYSAFGTKLNIAKFISDVIVERDIRITGVSVDIDTQSTANRGYSTAEEYNVKNINATVTLPDEDSYVTYNVEITNIGNIDMGILNITGLPDNLTYDTVNFSLKDKICDDTGKCSLGISRIVQLKVRYKEGSYDSSNTTFEIQLDFDFQPFYTVTYTDITNNGYPTEVIGGDTLVVDLGDSAPEELTITMDDEEITSYTYSNGILTIENVTGNIVIKEREPITYTSSTSTLAIDNTITKALKGYKIFGNSIQDTSNGNPSPTNPIDVYSVGDLVTDSSDANYGKYKIPISVSGKNLLNNANLLAKDTSNADFEVTDTGIKQTKLSSDGYGIFTVYDITDVVQPNTKYYFHVDIERNYKSTNNTSNAISGALRIYVDGKEIARIYSTSETGLTSYTFPASFESIVIKTWAVVADNSIENFDSNTQYYFEWKNLYMGTQEYTEYEPYKEIETHNIYLDQPLRSVGTYNSVGYTDYIDFSEGVVVRKVAKYNMNLDTLSDVAFTVGGLTTNNLYRHYMVHKASENYMVSGSRVGGFSNILPSNKEKWNNWTYEQVHFGQANRAIYLLFQNQYPTITDMYNYLSNNGSVEPYFIYALDTSVTTSINLPEINTITGNTVISVGTQVAPSTIEVQY